MLSPPEFAHAYAIERETADALKHNAGQQILLQICEPNEWLFSGRRKEEESALAKLQLGWVPALSEMHDLFAATIVVPTPAQLQKATEAVVAHFPTARVVPRDAEDPRRFVYDDVHLKATLGHLAPGDLTGIADRVFEIQIHTGLQYAWWRATHELIYKGRRSWALLRVASQIRASLELLDGVLADLSGAAERLGAPKTQDDRDFERVVAWLEKWADRLRPADVVRFFDQVKELADLPDVGLDEIDRLLGSPAAEAIFGEESITPLQGILGLVAAEHGAAVIDELREGRFVLVTGELQNLFPEVQNIPSGRLADL